MVDLAFTMRAKHFIPLALLRYIADSPSDDPPEEIQYIGKDGVKAIKGMSNFRIRHFDFHDIGHKEWNWLLAVD